ncbi:MAG: hypothetical protein M1553_09095 [Firmicutes bacterium]|nr:hypothetical protein [Bacillota bacterium]
MRLRDMDFWGSSESGLADLWRAGYLTSLSGAALDITLAQNWPRFG